MPARQPRLDERRALVRQVDEEIERLTNRWGAAAVLCECAAPGCIDPVELPRQDSAGARSLPDRYVAKDGHERDGDDIVETRAEAGEPVHG